MYYSLETKKELVLPAKQRIKEIEQGSKRKFMETIQDPYETQKIFDKLIKLANEEIMITLPSKTTTTNMSPYQNEQKYLLHLLRACSRSWSKT
jgi:hypothetical protein